MKKRNFLSGTRHMKWVALFVLAFTAAVVPSQKIRAAAGTTFEVKVDS